MNLQNVFVKNLKQIRKSKDITQEKLAELCETDTAYIGQIETKKRFPSINFIEKIASALGVESYILFRNESEMPQSVNAEELAGQLKELLLPEIRSEIETAIKDGLKQENLKSHI